MQGIFESVYGKQLWTSLDKREKEMKLVNSEVILGGIQPIRGLANAMMTEIVRVALYRRVGIHSQTVYCLHILFRRAMCLGRR